MIPACTLPQFISLILSWLVFDGIYSLAEHFINMLTPSSPIVFVCRMTLISVKLKLAGTTTLNSF